MEPPAGKQPAGVGGPSFGPSSEIHSRASDAGSVKDSASDAGSTATMDTSMSAGTHHTEVSAASTVFNPPHVHFFNLDEFAGHEIHAILEDGEREQEEEGEDAQEAGSQKESVRPGSVVSNIEQRLGDVTDMVDDQYHGGEFEGGGPSSAFLGGAGSSSSHMGGSAGSSSLGASSHVGGAGSSAADMRIALLEQMQYRELSASDLQLLLRLEEEMRLALIGFGSK